MKRGFCDLSLVVGTIPVRVRPWLVEDHPIERSHTGRRRDHSNMTTPIACQFRHCGRWFCNCSHRTVRPVARFHDAYAIAR